MPMIAGLSANHLAAVGFSETLRRLYIARDDDPAGDHAFGTLCERAREAGIEALPLQPQLDDFNSDLRICGAASLARHITAQMSGEDTAQFLTMPD